MKLLRNVLMTLRPMLQQKQQTKVPDIVVPMEIHRFCWDKVNLKSHIFHVISVHTRTGYEEQLNAHKVYVVMMI